MLTSYQKLRHFCLKLCSLGNIVEHCCKALIVAPPPHCWKLLISTQFHEPKVPSPPQWNNSCPFCTVFRTSANFRTFQVPWCRWTRPWCAVFRFWNLPTRRNSPTAASTAAARWQKWTKNKLPPSRSQQQQQQQPTNQQQHAMMQTSNTKAAFVLGDPSKGSHAAESKEEMMARAVRMKRKTKSCDAWGNFIQFVCSVEMCI